MWSSVKYKKYTVTRCWFSLLLQTVKLELASQTYIKTFSIQDISYLLVVHSAKKGKATIHSESTDHGPLTSFFVWLLLGNSTSMASLTKASSCNFFLIYWQSQITFRLEFELSISKIATTDTPSG